MLPIIKRFVILLGIAAVICSGTPQAFAQRSTGKRYGVKDTIPKAVGFVNDFEHLLTPVQEKTLDSIIRAYEKQTSIEIAVLTFDTTLSPRRDLEKFTLAVLNTWGVGKKEKNNGVLIAVSAGHRFMRIENGYGIEKMISDEETKGIIDTAILPLFKQRKYYDGILNGLNKLTAALNRKLK